MKKFQLIWTQKKKVIMMLTSKDIEWCEGVVCAVVLKKDNRILIMPKYPPDIKGGKTTLRSGLSYNSELVYVVMRDDVEKPEDEMAMMSGSKLTSKGIRWEGESVCAAVEINSNSVRKLLNQAPIDNGDVNEFHSRKVNQYHKEDFYIVMRDDTEKPEEKPLVYTQEMHDAGEKPVAGMRVNAGRGECTVDYIGRFVALVTFDGGTIELPTDVSDLKPIDTRTPEQKQVDEVAGFMLKHGRYTDAAGLAKLMQEQGVLKTVIKNSK